MESRYQNGFVRERNGKNKGGWQATFKFREYTGNWVTADGEIFEDQAEAIEHAGTSGVCHREFRWRTVSKRLSDTVVVRDEETGEPIIDAETGKPKTKRTGKRDAEKMMEEWCAQLDEEDARKAAEDEAAAKAEAEAEAAEVEAEVEEVDTEPEHLVTVAEYLDYYIAGRDIERSTLSEYNRLAHKLTNPTLGDIPLRDLKPADVRDWVSMLAKKYEPVTVRKALVLLRSALEQALDDDIITKNPARRVKAPSQPKSKVNVLDDDSRQKLLDFLLHYLNVNDPEPAFLGIMLALYTGMREGEICALRWDDVDFDKLTITVDEAIGNEQGKGGGYYVKTPKTDESDRVIPLDDQHRDLLHALSLRKGAMERECIQAKVPFEESFFILGDIDGSFLRPRTLYNKWRALAETLDLMGTQKRRPSFHDLRHTYATVAITVVGTDVKTVSESLGHKDASMTLNTYTSTNKGAARRSANSVADVYREEAELGSKRGAILEVKPTGTDD